MQSSPSCWPGKGLEKMIFFFFPYFLNTYGRPRRSPCGWTPIEGGRMFPPALRVVPEPRPCPEVGPGRRSRPNPRLRVRPAGPEAPPSLRSPARSLRPGSKGRGTSVLERAASQRRPCRHPSGAGWRAAPRKHRLKQSLSGKIRTLCKIILFFLNAVW